MGAHPGNRYVGTCATTGKRQYASRKDARAVARAQGEVHAFLCDGCGLFHVGHQHGRSRDEMRRRSSGVLTSQTKRRFEP